MASNILLGVTEKTMFICIWRSAKYNGLVKSTEDLWWCFWWEWKKILHNLWDFHVDLPIFREAKGFLIPESCLYQLQHDFKKKHHLTSSCQQMFMPSIELCLKLCTTPLLVSCVIIFLYLFWRILMYHLNLRGSLVKLILKQLNWLAMEHMGE